MNIPNLDFEFQELYNVIESLASGVECIKDRIMNASVSHLDHLRPEIDDDNKREYFDLLNKDLKRQGYLSFIDILDKLDEPINDLPEEECENICKTLVKTFEIISRDCKEESITNI